MAQRTRSDSGTSLWLFLALVLAGCVLAYSSFSAGVVIGMIISVLVAGFLAFMAPRTS